MYAWRILHSGQTCLNLDLGEQSLCFGSNVLGELPYLSHLTATFFHPYQPLLCCILKMLPFEVTSVLFIFKTTGSNWFEMYLISQYHLKIICTWLVCFSRQHCLWSDFSLFLSPTFLFLHCDETRTFIVLDCVPQEFRTFYLQGSKGFIRLQP